MPTVSPRARPRLPPRGREAPVIHTTEATEHSHRLTARDNSLKRRSKASWRSGYAADCKSAKRISQAVVIIDKITAFGCLTFLNFPQKTTEFRPNCLTVFGQAGHHHDHHPRHHRRFPPARAHAPRPLRQSALRPMPIARPGRARRSVRGGLQHHWRKADPRRAGVLRLRAPWRVNHDPNACAIATKCIKWPNMSDLHFQSRKQR